MPKEALTKFQTIWLYFNISYLALAPVLLAVLCGIWIELRKLNK